MSIDTSQHPFFFTPDFIELMAELKVGGGGGNIFNFRDRSYCAESGGYHPVEIAMSRFGVIQYVTDFSFMGDDLIKELDWDFGLGRFSQFGQEYELEDGRALFYLYQSNFTAYYRSGVYELTVSDL